MCKDKLEEAAEIIYLIVDGEECRFDHHGYCQGHGFLQDGNCPQGIAQKWLKENYPEKYKKIFNS